MSSRIDPKDLRPCMDCTCFNIRKTSRVVTQIYDEIMQAAGLRGTQFTILAMVGGNESLGISTLAVKLVMDRTTLTRNLRPLEKQGLIQVVPGKDRRTREVRLTSQGQRVLAEALPLWRKAQQKVSRFMGKERLGHLIDELRSLEKIATTS